MESKYRFIYMVIGLLAIIGAGIGIYYIMKDKKEDNSENNNESKKDEKKIEKKDEKTIENKDGKNSNQKDRKKNLNKADEENNSKKGEQNSNITDSNTDEKDEKNVDNQEADKKDTKEINVIHIKNNDKKNLEQQKTEKSNGNNEKAAIPSTTNAKPNSTTEALLTNTQNKETTNTNLSNQENKAQKNVTGENKKNLQRQAENKSIVEEKENFFDVKENLIQLQKEFEEFKNLKTIPNHIEKINMAEKLIKFDRTLHNKLKIDYALPIEKALTKLKFDLFNYIVFKNLNLNYTIENEVISITFDIDKYNQNEIYDKIKQEFDNFNIIECIEVENDNEFLIQHKRKMKYIHDNIKKYIHNFINNSQYSKTYLSEDLRILNYFLKFKVDGNFNQALVFLQKFDFEEEEKFYKVKLTYEIMTKPKEEELKCISGDLKNIFYKHLPIKIIDDYAKKKLITPTTFFDNWLKMQKLDDAFSDKEKEDMRNYFIAIVKLRKFEIEEEEKKKSEEAYQNYIGEFKVDN